MSGTRAFDGARRVRRYRLRLFVGGTAGTLCGASIGALMFLGGGRSEPEQIAAAAVIAVISVAVGCILGTLVALDGYPYRWVVAVVTAAAFSLEYPIIRAALPERDPIEAFGAGTWVGLIVGSLVLIPQVVLGVVELVARAIRWYEMPHAPRP